MTQQTFIVTGMSCSACSAAVENAVRKLNGVDGVSVNLLTGTMSVKFDRQVCTENDIIYAVTKAGYEARVKNDDIRKVKQDKLNKSADKLLIRLIVSVVLLCVLMLVSMGHMIGLNIIPHDMVILRGIVEFALTVPIVILNFKYFTSGFKAVFRLNPNMDSLIAIGALTSILFSLWELFSGGAEHYYFESASMILTFITIGKYFEGKSKAKTTSAVNKLLDLTPKKSLILVDGDEVEVNSEDIKVGDTVIMKAGMYFPADGIVTSGFGSADESTITGESIPSEKSEGNKVVGGTHLVNGYLQFKALKVGKDTTLSGIVKLVEQATASKPKIARFADKISRIFVPSVILIAIITTALWLIFTGDFELSLNFGISVLVISCPCALGLATPTAIMVGTGRAAELGILIKSAEIFETSSNIKTVLFDKTGTITKGKPEVMSFHTNGTDEMQLLQICGAIESLSDHPLASAVVKYSRLDSFPEVTDFESTIGKGVKGKVLGREIYIGNLKFVRKFTLPPTFESTIEQMKSRGETILYVAENKEIIGLFGVADSIKESATEAISELKSSGIETVMITGDNKQTANIIKNKVGITKVEAELMPADKNRIIKEYQKLSPVAMVGDGINDSPALAAADVGIALGAGTDIAMESADVVLIRNDLRDVGKTLEICKKVMRNIKENLFWALIYNSLCIPIAAGVLYLTPLHIKLSPMIGTLAMSLSSICVISNALRLRNIKRNNNISTERNVQKMKTVYIEGMACGHCEARVKEALSALDADVKVDFKTGTAAIKESADNDAIIKTVTDAGYKVTDIK